MNLDELNRIARAMVQKGKGILAADESSGTIKKRFDKIGVESTEENRRDYRELLFRSAEGDEAHLRRHPVRRNHPPESEGRHAAGEADRAGGRHSRHQGGQGRQAACRFSKDETVTEGLDGLRERLVEYHGLGARFAKWRATYRRRRKGVPRYNCINANAQALARYAALCQEEQHRADRRARSADGFRQRYRRLRSGHGMGAEGNVSRSSTTPTWRSKAWC